MARKVGQSVASASRGGYWLRTTCDFLRWESSARPGAIRTARPLAESLYHNVAEEKSHAETPQPQGFHFFKLHKMYDGLPSPSMCLSPYSTGLEALNTSSPD